MFASELTPQWRSASVPRGSQGHGGRRAARGRRSGSRSSGAACPGNLATAATVVIPERVALALFAVSFVGLNLMHMAATWARVYVRPSWRSHRSNAWRYRSRWRASRWPDKPSEVERCCSPSSTSELPPRLDAELRAGSRLPAANRPLRRTRLDLAALPACCPARRCSIGGRRMRSVCRSAAAVGANVARADDVGRRRIGVGGVRLARVALASPRRTSIRSGIGILLGHEFGSGPALLVGNPHPAMPLYALASGRCAQYLYFVWHAEARETSDGLVHRSGCVCNTGCARRGTAVHRAPLGDGRRGDVAPHVRVCRIALGRSTSMTLRPENALDIPPWAAAMIGVNLEHYWLDHRIWRTSRRRAQTTGAGRCGGSRCRSASGELRQRVFRKQQRGARCSR